MPERELFISEAAKKKCPGSFHGLDARNNLKLENELSERASGRRADQSHLAAQIVKATKREVMMRNLSFLLKRTSHLDIMATLELRSWRFFG